MFRLRIRQHELALRFRHGDFVGLMHPGTYLDPKLLGRGVTVEVFDTLATRFQHERVDLLIRDPELASELEVVDVLNRERGILWKDGRIEAMLGPGRHAFWKRPYDLKVEGLRRRRGTLRAPTDRIRARARKRAAAPAGRPGRGLRTRPVLPAR